MNGITLVSGLLHNKGAWTPTLLNLMAACLWGLMRNICSWPLEAA